MTSQHDIAPTAKISATCLLKGVGRLVVGDHAVIEDFVTIDTSQNTQSLVLIGPRSKIKTGSVLRTYGGNMKIGSRTSIGEYNVLASHGGLSVGCECMFGPYVFINAASHIVEGAEPFRFQGETAVGVEIEDDVWLGARCSILDGVRIGRRAVVGAHSLVLHDIPAGHLAFGQPAKPHRTVEGAKHESISER